jgi:hypothetical protein
MKPGKKRISLLPNGHYFTSKQEGEEVLATMSNSEESSSSTGEQQQFVPISHPPSLSPDRIHAPRPPHFHLNLFIFRIIYVVFSS